MISGQRRRAASIFVALLAVACGGQGDSAAPPVRIEPFASVPSPPSRSPHLILLKDGAACVVDTYWYRVICTHPDGESVTFGQEGRGPGEFVFPDALLRAPAGAIGVVDISLNRLSVFARSGELVTSTSDLPNQFDGGRRKAMGETMAGSYHRYRPNGGSSLLDWVNVDVDAATGRVVWARAFPPEADVVRCSTPGWEEDRQLGMGYEDGSGDVLFVTCRGEFLVWYADRDASQPAATVRTTYVERYPTDEEVAFQLRGLQSAPWRSAISEEEIRSRPKPWYGPRVMDDRRRFLAVSHWNGLDHVTPRHSYIDVFRLVDGGPEYALTLQVTDKVVGMDVLGDTLAVLVVRDVGGVVPERRVDWYDISTVDHAVNDARKESVTEP
ncbi:MAG: hypothetical protein F4X22_15025 [Gemmatimonadales bacterium]|nr:hypothetical protein [Candidatus Palauibacter denitrificans]